MAISVLQGRSYSIENGLSTESQTYYVVGKFYSPQRVDSSLGWKDYDDSPSYTVTVSYLVRKAIFNGETWQSYSDEVEIVPSNFVERVLESIDLERIPSVVEGPSYLDLNDLSSSKTWFIEDIIERPVRIDKALMWKDPEYDKPEFLTVSCAICLPAYYDNIWRADTNSETFIVPLFLISNVYEWTQTSYRVDPSTVNNTIIVVGPKGDKGDSGEKGESGNRGNDGSTGATGAMGPRGFQGADGSEGAPGPQGSAGPQGVAGPQGAIGPQGELEKNYDFFYQSNTPNGSGTSSILPGSTWYNTSTSITYVYIFDGEDYYWLTINVQGPVGVQGPAGSFEPPKMTTTEILSIVSPSTGTTIFNTTLNAMCYYDGSDWKVLNNTNMI
jgi:hypothetical protein